MFRTHMLVFIFLFFALLAAADRVILQNGRTIRGRIIERTESRVSFLTSAGNFSLLKKDIAKIEEESPEENFLLEVELSLAKKDAVSALSAYKQALSQGLPPERLEEHFLRNHLPLASALHLASEYEKRKIGNLLIDLVAKEKLLPVDDSSTTISMEFAFMAAVFLSDTEKREAAGEILAGIPQRFFLAFPEKRSYAAAFFKAETLRLATLDDFNGAVGMLENLQVLNTTAERSSRLLLYLRWGAHLREQKQWQDAAAVYAEKLAPLSDEIAANRLSFLFDKMEEQAGSESDLSQVILLLKNHASLVPPDELRSRLGRLFTSAGRLSLDDAGTTAARTFFKAAFLAGGREDSSLLALCDYRERFANLEPDDSLGHFRLAVFCRKNGLIKEAKGHFHIAGHNPDLKAAVEKERRLINTREGIDVLKQALDLYDQARYGLAMDALEPLLQDDATSGVRDEAAALAELCRSRLEHESSKRPLKAQIYYQQAERHFLLEEHDKALLKLEFIIETYPDAPVIPKARDLMLLSLRRRDLARLEHPEKVTGTTGVVPRIVPGDSSKLKTQLDKLLETIQNE